MDRVENRLDHPIVFRRAAEGVTREYLGAIRRPWTAASSISTHEFAQGGETRPTAWSGLDRGPGLVWFWKSNPPMT